MALPLSGETSGSDCVILENKNSSGVTGEGLGGLAFWYPHPVPVGPPAGTAVPTTPARQVLIRGGEEQGAVRVPVCVRKSEKLKNAEFAAQTSTP